MTANETHNYSSTELLACVAARILEDKKSVFVGTGLPIIAATLAQRTHAPNLLVVFEAGGVGSQIPVLPLSVGDSRTFYRAVMASSMHDTMAMSQAGYLDYGFLGAAQIDVYGNINTTLIGSYTKPRVRLPGSGGANDVGSLCWRTIILMRQDRKRFVNDVDFLTTPGYLTGPGSREAVGLPADGGPYRVITQLGVYGFDDSTKRMNVVSLHPGTTLEQVRAASEFEITVSGKPSRTKPPTRRELKILHEIDPEGIVVS
ncbi:3-oxoacid CoA-transferase [miscellaneous Crenarchaeota group archaeon SMTZ1-55]|nr:MAG: 3-oxoacid CoA-transferase [miscellaneous Crenarchaeota group archaeon SMTZ1-55]